MSNTTTKVNSFISLGYSILAAQTPNEKVKISIADTEDVNGITSYQNALEENITPDMQQVVQTILPINPTTLRI